MELPGANNAQLEHRQVYAITSTSIYYELLSEDRGAYYLLDAKTVLS